MGGEFTETVTTQTTPSPEKKGGTTKIEFHVNIPRGEVHFHDRTQGLKVAVPVAEWFKEGRILSRATENHTWKYHDTVNHTLLTIHQDIDQSEIEAGGNTSKIHTHIMITIIDRDEMTSKLINFFNNSLEKKEK